MKQKNNDSSYLKSLFNYLDPNHKTHPIQGRIAIFNLSWWMGFTIFVVSCLTILLTSHEELIIIINALK